VPWLSILNVRMNKVAPANVFFSEYFTVFLPTVFTPLSHNCNYETLTVISDWKIQGEHKVFP
jgi:hypothetical protein